MSQFTESFYYSVVNFNYFIKLLMWYFSGNAAFPVSAVLSVCLDVTLGGLESGSCISEDHVDIGVQCPSL